MKQNNQLINFVIGIAGAILFLYAAGPFIFNFIVAIIGIIMMLYAWGGRSAHARMYRIYKNNRFE